MMEDERADEDLGDVGSCLFDYAALTHATRLVISAARSITRRWRAAVAASPRIRHSPASLSSGVPSQAL
jgi:hypothetical protein